VCVCILFFTCWNVFIQQGEVRQSAWGGTASGGGVASFPASVGASFKAMHILLLRERPKHAPRQRASYREPAFSANAITTIEPTTLTAAATHKNTRLSHEESQTKIIFNNLKTF
jgi:hypothetical protein